MTVSVRSPGVDENEAPQAATATTSAPTATPAASGSGPISAPSPSRRSSLADADFRAAVVEHVVHTCAKEIRDASALDFYHALAHTVRDRLVHRWLATQRTHVERDVKRVCYLSSEFLTGRSLGPLSDEHGSPQSGAGAGRRLRLRSRRDPRVRGRSRAGQRRPRPAGGLLHGLARDAASCPRSATASATTSACSSRRIDGGRQVEQHDNWLHLGNAWELPRHEDAQTVRFGGRVVFQHDRDGRLRADWIDTQAVIGLPYDSFIVGHRTDTANTLRLWAARATRDFDLQFFNEGDYRRAVEEKIDTENISKVLYPNDQSDEGKALRLKQQYFFVACSIADIDPAVQAAARRLRAVPRKVRDPAERHAPSIAVAELMRVLVDEEGIDWDAAWSIVDEDDRVHQPHAVARGARALAGDAVRAPAAAPPADHLRDQPAVPLAGAAALAGTTASGWRACRSSRSRRGKQVRMAHLATVGRAQHQRRRRAAHRAGQDASCLPDFYELWPERFNNKTNGVTPRRWVLHANPRLTRLLIESHRRRSWIDLTRARRA